MKTNRNHATDRPTACGAKTWIIRKTISLLNPRKGTDDIFAYEK